MTEETREPLDARILAMRIGQATRDWMFREAEARLGYTWRNGAKVYCCYGMYADVGHDIDCEHRTKGGATP